MSHALVVLPDPEPFVLWLESLGAAENGWKNRSELVPDYEEKQSLLISWSPQKCREPQGMLCGSVGTPGWQSQ